jgi:hypothetical protein
MNMHKASFKPQLGLMTLLLAGLMSGCGGDGGSAGPGLGLTGSVCNGSSCVNLGTAGNYVILAQTGVSSIPSSPVTGNIGLSPAARTFLTGWSLISEPTDTSFGSSQVTGRLFAADNVGGPTSANLTTAVADMGTAYTVAAGLSSAGGGLITACPGTGILDGLTITPGVYTCSVGLSIGVGTNVTLFGSATDVWVIRTTQGINQAAATQVILAGGALAKNVFWQSAGTVTVGANAIMQGVILAKTNIVMGTGATENGRLLAQTAVTLDQNTITQP